MRSSQHAKPATHKGPGKKKAEPRAAAASGEGIDATTAASAEAAATALSEHTPQRRAPRQRGKSRADRGAKRGAEGGHDQDATGAAEEQARAGDGGQDPAAGPPAS